MSNHTTQRPDLMTARAASEIVKDELSRIDVRTVIIGVYWNGGYRYIHLTPQVARELFAHRFTQMELAQAA